MGDVDQRVAALAARGMSAEAIAGELGIPVERVRAHLEESPGEDYDSTDADSFPASDPPPGPVR